MNLGRLLRRSRTRCRRTNTGRSRYQLGFDRLEDRLAPAILTVTTLLDNIAGSLRAAVFQAQNGDTIHFADGLTGTITLTTGELNVNSSVMIIGPGENILSVDGNQNGSVFNIASNQTVSISGLTITHGKASDQNGGGISNAGALIISDCAITSNISTGGFLVGGGAGGGIFNTGTLTINNCTLSHNTANSGGGILSTRVLSATGSMFSGNSGDGLSAAGSATLTSCTISNNAGGGVSNTGNMTLNACTITGNTLTNGTQGGAGISSDTLGGFVGGGGTLTINASTIANDSSTGQGGGINSTGPANFTNDTIAENSASSGGGIYDDGGLALLCCTLADNSANKTGGGIFEEASGSTAVSLKNTIVGKNTASMANDISGSPATTSDYNLIGDGKGLSGLLDGINGNQIGFLNKIDPLIGPLQNNGGPTLTCALLPGSLAIGAGDPTNAPTYDQRGTGFPRVVNGKIDIGAYETQSASVAQLVLNASPTAIAGAPFDVTVTAEDSSGNPVAAYAGTVTFSSTDRYPGVVLPHDYIFTAGDNGTHTFTGGVTLFTAGMQTIMVTDTANSSLNASASVTVDQASASHFVLTPSSSTVVAGTPFNVTVAAVDPYNNPVPGYTGTVILTSSDRNPQPSIYTFTSSDNGSHVFSSVSLLTAGMQTLLAQDAVNGSITGTAPVAVQAAPADQFLITAPPTAVAGTPFDVIVTALDAYGNTATNYQGTVTLTTSDPDPGIVLPTAPYTFTTGSGGDNGVHAFLGVTLITPGNQMLTATDAANGIAGSATVTVNSPAPPPGGGAVQSRNPSISEGITPTGSVWSGQEISWIDQVFAPAGRNDSGLISFQWRKHFRRTEANGFLDFFGPEGTLPK
jgi:hypothetical protein